MFNKEPGNLCKSLKSKKSINLVSNFVDSFISYYLDNSMENQGLTLGILICMGNYRRHQEIKLYYISIRDNTMYMLRLPRHRFYIMANMVGNYVKQDYFHNILVNKNIYFFNQEFWIYKSLYFNNNLYIKWVVKNKWHKLYHKEGITVNFEFHRKHSYRGKGYYVKINLTYCRQDYRKYVYWHSLHMFYMKYHIKCK